MKILLFKTGAIGDVLMTTPLLRQLKKSYPKSKIHYAIGEKSSTVLKGNKNLSKIIPFDEDIFFKKNLVAAAGLLSKLRQEKYDLIFVLDKHWAVNLFSFFTSIPERIGFDRNGEGWQLTAKVNYGLVRHEIKYYLDLLKTAGKKPNYRDTKMDFTISKKVEGFAFPEKSVAICPGAGNNPGESSNVRKWGDKNYAKLAKQLSKKGFYPFFVGVKGDVDEKLIEGYPNFIGKTNLEQAAAILKAADWVVTNDNGLMHLAAVNNKKVISLFGPTNPKRKAPLWSQSTAIWKDQDIYQEDYELYGTLPEGKFMKKIKVGDVVKCLK